MRRSLVTTGSVLGLLAAFLLAPAPAAGQDFDDGVTADREKARNLYEVAQQLEAADDRGLQLTAARLYSRAALRWSDGAEDRYQSLWRGGHLYLQHGRSAEAKVLFAEAAREARANGDLQRAAVSSLRQARLQAEEGDRESAGSSLAEAEGLIEDAELTEAERTKLAGLAEDVRLLITRLGR